MKQVLSQNIGLIGNDWVIGHPTMIFTDDDVPVEVFTNHDELNTFIASQGIENYPSIPIVGEQCEFNKIYAYGVDKVKCLQEHIRMAFTPEETPALWLIIYTVVGYPEWVQPTGAHDAYAIGDIVTYNSELWISKINANTTIPDGDIPFNRYWEPYIV